MDIHDVIEIIHFSLTPLQLTLRYRHILRILKGIIFAYQLQERKRTERATSPDKARSNKGTG